MNAQLLDTPRKQELVLGSLPKQYIVTQDRLTEDETGRVFAFISIPDDHSCLFHAVAAMKIIRAACTYTEGEHGQVERKLNRVRMRTSS